MAARRAKWHPPPAQTPRILNLPRRSRSARVSRAKPSKNLGSLFDTDRRVKVESAPASPPLREEDSGEERWRFQAEILRAECNFLRMEREVALRKLDRHRGQMEAALKSAMEILISGRKKIDGRELEEEIQDLQEMLEEVRMEREGSGGRKSGGLRELQRCKGRNFDRQASTLRRRLEKMPQPEEVSIKEIREIALPVLNQQEIGDQFQDVLESDDCWNQQLSDVEMLKRKMEGLSKGMKERMAEYGQLLSDTDDKTKTLLQLKKENESNSSKKNSREWGRAYMAKQQQQQPIIEECNAAHSGACCECREMVGKIMEQVKAETEQWTEMQGMLDQVRNEMQELQSSRDSWQRRAISSDINVRSLHAQILEWKHKARISERNVEDLQKRVSDLQNKLHSMKIEFLTQACSSQESSDVCKMNLRIKRSTDHKKREKPAAAPICPLQEISNTMKGQGNNY